MASNLELIEQLATAERHAKAERFEQTADVLRDLIDKVLSNVHREISETPNVIGLDFDRRRG